ncbi:amidohydrolase/deacetylase family metallohydrolase [Oceanobacillus caeni]|uniref:amidohydrolase/deacetylase family metallohydrolase n=1 Tax=Oceanobacillus caeni TaxID=405946 RepID=UPI00062270E5|nr:amidohydrolase/deacetylase family metallohydrolase [Oceanobacillus caeni]KKE77774.1 amidohydrolase [Bacilli bacterium VT-13-104]PZD87309.1 amidohydrolase/deacetylase family metallohydrolase [Bacilli bacterium]MCR1835447.1 amidohydrolase/deacetylase family metallohydrolase [Oceanobacillus caeni]PZD88783.1 amidohydrolase/deacetylase family metallohydrolase [Bacilli bacterium]PZD91637.1 amidohydrolase/deacetylase family metallohydrolase [Bacilli bacterium]
MTARFVLQNVKMIEGNSVDIVVEDRKIVDLAPPGTGVGGTIIDYKNNAYVSSGWIDMHVHAFPEFDPYGDDIDEIGYKTGVTTIIDAGSTGADRIHDLVRNSKDSKTNVFAFLNISRIGLKRVDELSDLTLLNEDELKRAVEENKDFIVGLKARISKSVVGTNGVEPLKIARKFSEDTDLPLMVHIGSGPPNINDVLDLLKKDDVITHYLNGKSNNLFDETGKPLPKFLEAIKRGVHLDVGHGNASFSFKTAEQAREFDIQFNTISTDIYRKNRLHGPVYNMASILTKFLYLGYPLKEVIEAVTVGAARWLNKPALGRISKGDIANLTLFSVEDEAVDLIDSEGERRKADQRIVVKGVVINGEYNEC